jgi:maltose alpha-D-glucosyltransferase/alpha-amylase
VPGDPRPAQIVPGNRRLVAYLGRHQDQIALVVNHLSRFPQAVELNLRGYQGMTAVEMFGQTPFLAIGTVPT